MADSYTGEIRMISFFFAPIGWAFCDGAILNISQAPQLFNIIGTTYGGNGTTTFALPDLRGRFPVGQGQAPGMENYIIGQAGGTETAALQTPQLPQHSHMASACGNPGNSPGPQNNYWAASNQLQPYNIAPDPANDPISFNSAAIGITGGNQPHENMMPFIPGSFIICLAGDL